MIVSALAAMAFAADVKLSQPTPYVQKAADAVIIIKPDDRRDRWRGPPPRRDWRNHRGPRRPDVHVHEAPKAPWWYWGLKALNN